MAPAKQRHYRFSPESIAELRKKLGLSQAGLARSLGVPPNTVSRWETGATAPDASSLAAIHSVAMESGITPSFFRKRKGKKQTAKRTRLLVVWDFENLTALEQYVSNIDAWVREECEKRFPTTTERTFKAFVRTSQWNLAIRNTTGKLDDLGWEVWEETDDVDEEIIHHSKSDCGHEPLRTILVLMTRDGDYVEMIGDLKAKGVRIYLLGVEFGQDLVTAVGKKRLIELPSPENLPWISVSASHHPWLTSRIGGHLRPKFAKSARLE